MDSPLLGWAAAITESRGRADRAEDRGRSARDHWQASSGEAKRRDGINGLVLRGDGCADGTGHGSALGPLAANRVRNARRCYVTRLETANGGCAGGLLGFRMQQVLGSSPSVGCGPKSSSDLRQGAGSGFGICRAGGVITDCHDVLGGTRTLPAKERPMTRTSLPILNSPGAPTSSRPCSCLSGSAEFPPSGSRWHAITARPLPGRNAARPTSVRLSTEAPVTRVSMSRSVVVPGIVGAVNPVVARRDWT